MTSVTYGMQYTRNLGNFENARVYFEITDDLRKGESIDQAKARITAKVNAWVVEEISKIDADAGQ